MSWQGCPSVLFPYPCPSPLRPEKGGSATGVDAVCTYQPDPSGLQLDRERLYWELSHQTRGVTQLGSYFLDRDSLYVNGEHLVATGVSSCTPDGLFCGCSELWPEDTPASASRLFSPPSSFPYEIPLPHQRLYHTEAGGKSDKRSGRHHPQCGRDRASSWQLFFHQWSSPIIPHLSLSNIPPHSYPLPAGYTRPPLTSSPSGKCSNPRWLHVPTAHGNSCSLSPPRASWRNGAVGAWSPSFPHLCLP